MQTAIIIKKKERKESNFSRRHNLRLRLQCTYTVWTKFTVNNSSFTSIRFGSILFRLLHFLWNQLIVFASPLYKRMPTSPCIEPLYWREKRFPRLYPQTFITLNNMIEYCTYKRYRGPVRYVYDQVRVFNIRKIFWLPFMNKNIQLLYIYKK